MRSGVMCNGPDLVVVRYTVGQDGGSYPSLESGTGPGPVLSLPLLQVSSCYGFSP